ncbi:MAG: YdcF family protein [Rhizobiaceae bacterium]
MFFILSKLFWVIARPLNLLFFLSLAGMVAWRTGLHRLARTVLSATIIVFAVTGFTQLPDLLIWRLEDHVIYPALPTSPYGIIILGGGLDASKQMQVEGYHLGEAADRLVLGLELKRRYPDARLIYSGGLATIAADGLPETRAALDMTRALYGDDRGMEFEGTSRNTWQNAVFTGDLVGEDRSREWLLVTSAFHMPRALGCFRKNGFTVLPVPTDYRADELVFPWLTGDVAGQFIKMSLFSKEIIGLVAYRFTGKMDELFPR